MNKKEFLEDIQLAYTNALINIMSKWVHDDDGANNHYQCQVKQVETYNNIMLIYQPEKQDDWVENAFAIITHTKESEFEITEELWEKITNLIDEVEYRFIDSVNEFIVKHNGWIQESSNLTFDSILNIISPLHYTKGKLIMKFGIGCYMDIPFMCWTPVSLVQWMFTLLSYQRYRKVQVEKDTNELEKGIEKMKSQIEVYKEELHIAFNQLHYFSLQEKISNLETCIKEAYESIENMKERLTKVDKVEKIYNYIEEEYLEHGLHKGYHKVEKIVPYKKPLVIRLSLAGNKRCFSET